MSDGSGVSQNYVLAHMWFNLAVTNGDEVSLENRDFAASKMTKAQIAEAQKLAREWKPKKWFIGFWQKTAVHRVFNLK